MPLSVSSGYYDTSLSAYEIRCYSASILEHRKRQGWEGWEGVDKWVFKWHITYTEKAGIGSRGKYLIVMAR